MKLIQDKLHYTVPWELPDVFLFTGNPIVNRSGGIVMGRGAAREVRDHYPGIDRVFGELITKQPTAHLLWAEIKSKSVVPSNQYIGWFKVKHHWSHDADRSLIQASTDALRELALRKKKFRFHMNFPGIGNGRLTYGSVLPILQELPDNVRIYKIAPQLEADEIPW